MGGPGSLGSTAKIYRNGKEVFETSILKKKMSWGFENDFCHSSKIDDLELYYSKLLNIDRGPYVYWWYNEEL